MSLNALGLGFLFTATDLASGVMKNVAANFQGLETAAGRNIAGLDKMMKDLGAGLMTTAVGAGGLGASFGLAMKAGGLEHAINSVGIHAKLTTDQMQRLRDFAVRTAPTLGVAPLRSMEVMRMLVQAGNSVERSFVMLPNVLKFAAAGQMDVATAAGLANQAMRAFSLNGELLTTVLDQLVGSANSFSLNVEDLRIGLARASSGASLYGSTLTETLATYGLMKDVLDSVQVSGTATSYLFQRLSNPKYHPDIKKVLGIDIFDTATGRYKKFTGIMAEMIPKLQKLDQTQLNQFLVPIFGMEAVKGITTMLARVQAGFEDVNGVTKYGAEAWVAAVDKISREQGVLEHASHVLLTDFEGTMNRLRETWDSTTTIMGEPFKENWTPILKSALDVLAEFNRFMMRMPMGLQRVVAGILQAGSAFLVLTGSLGLAKAAFPLFKGGFDLVKVAVLGLSRGLGAAFSLLNPVGLAIAAIGVLAWAVSENIGGLGDKFHKVVDALSEGANTLSSYFEPLWAAFSEGFNSMMPDLDVIFAWIGESIDSLITSFSEIAEAFGFTSPAGNKMVGIFKMLGAVASTVLGVVGSLIGTFFKLASAIWSAISWVVTGLADKWKKYISPWLDPFLDKLDKWLGISDLAASFAPKTQPEDAVKPPEAAQEKPAVEEPGGKKDSRIDVKSGHAEAETKPAQAAVASHSNIFHGVMPSRQEQLINYDEMGRALAKMPQRLYVDGHNLVGVIERIRSSEASRMNDLG